MLKHLPLWLLIYYFLVFVTTLVSTEATTVLDANVQNTLGREILRCKPLVQLGRRRAAATAAAQLPFQKHDHRESLC